MRGLQIYDDVPKWLLLRMNTARYNCISPKSSCWGTLGGKGIEFRFPTVRLACVWVIENLGLKDNCVLERIDKKGHFEPGNLQWGDEGRQRRPKSENSLVGMVSGKLVIVSPDIESRQKGKRRVSHVLCRCTVCGDENWRVLSDVKRTRAGCPSCRKAYKQFPAWLRVRLNSIRSRCTNPKSPLWEYYGGKGIEFRFKSVGDAGIWIRDYLGLERDKNLTRVDKTGHFERGNMKWEIPDLARLRQGAQLRSQQLLQLREAYPDVGYPDGTLKVYFNQGITAEEINVRWQKKRILDTWILLEGDEQYIQRGES